MENIHFKSFVPSENLRNRTERALDRIVDQAPIDAIISIMLEHVESGFRCKIEIGSSSGPFAVETNHRFAPIALDKAELNILRKLDRWKGMSVQPSSRKILRNPSLDSRAS